VKKMFILSMLLISICLILPTAEASGEDIEENAENNKTTEKKELTKEQVIDRLNDIFQRHEEIWASIPGIVVSEADEGYIISYKSTQIEQLDKDTLFKLLRIVNQQLSIENIKNIENLQRTQQQLKNIKNLTNINRTLEIIRQQQSPPITVPQVHVPPKIPKIHTPPKAHQPPKRY
jgi:5-bromo-4-chloroindolyl phosphate hydrolysis protein